MKYIDEKGSKFYNSFNEKILFLTSVHTVLNDDFEDKILMTEQTNVYLQKAEIRNGSFLNKEVIEHFLNRIIFINLFSEFEIYLFNISKYCLEKHPSLLGNSSIEIGELLQDNFEKELILEKIIEQKLHAELFDLKKGLIFISKTLGLKFNIDTDLNENLTLIKIFRDLIVHSGGIVNTIAVKKSKNNLKLGDNLKITKNLVNSTINLLEDIVETIDKNLINNYPEISELKEF